MDIPLEAYLDIETTGLFPYYHEITVIGIYLVRGNNDRLVQLVGEKVTKDNLLKALDGVYSIYTYNGSRFDLPFIRVYMGVDLTDTHHHHDLMYDCWKHSLYGGLKVVEEQLGITRQLKGISGREAVTLWWRYQNYSDQDALALLLQYNREDITNLKVLREILAV